MKRGWERFRIVVAACLLAKACRTLDFSSSGCPVGDGDVEGKGPLIFDMVGRGELRDNRLMLDVEGFVDRCRWIFRYTPLPRCIWKVRSRRYGDTIYPSIHRRLPQNKTQTKRKRNNNHLTSNKQ